MKLIPDFLRRPKTWQVISVLCLFASGVIESFWVKPISDNSRELVDDLDRINRYRRHLDIKSDLTFLKMSILPGSVDNFIEIAGEVQYATDIKSKAMTIDAMRTNGRLNYLRHYIILCKKYSYWDGFGVRVNFYNEEKIISMNEELGNLEDDFLKRGKDIKGEVISPTSNTEKYMKLHREVARYARGRIDVTERYKKVGDNIVQFLVLIATSSGIIGIYFTGSRRLSRQKVPD